MNCHTPGIRDIYAIRVVQFLQLSLKRITVEELYSEYALKQKNNIPACPETLLPVEFPASFIKKESK